MNNEKPTEVLNGGMIMKFYVPSFQLNNIESMVDKTIIIKTENLNFISTLKKVNTAKIKQEGDSSIFKQITVEINEIVSAGNSSIIDCMLLQLPDPKQEIIDMQFSVSY